MLEIGRWYTVDLAWDLSKPSCTVFLNGSAALQLKLNNETLNGISYLRLRSLAPQPDPAGFLVESVVVNIEEPGRAAPNRRRDSIRI